MQKASSETKHSSGLKLLFVKTLRYGDQLKAINYPELDGIDAIVVYFYFSKWPHLNAVWRELIRTTPYANVFVKTTKRNRKPVGRILKKVFKSPKIYFQR